MLPFNRTRGIHAMITQMNRVENAARMALGDFQSGDAVAAAKPVSAGGLITILLIVLGTMAAGIFSFAMT